MKISESTYKDSLGRTRIAPGRIIENNYIYISHLDDDLQYWILPSSPDEISDSMSSSYASTNALARTAPVLTYSNSGPRTVQVSLQLHRDMMYDCNVNISNSRTIDGDDYVDDLIKALQAIALPKYNLNNKAVEPPLVAIRFGKQIFIKGVVTSAIGVNYSKPIQDDEKMAVVNVSFTVSEVDPYDSTAVFKNGSFRGVVKTLKKGMNLE